MMAAWVGAIALAPVQRLRDIALMNALAESDLAAWHLAMEKLREFERRLEVAVHAGDVHAAWAAHDEVDRAIVEAALLLASAVEAGRAQEHGRARRVAAPQWHITEH
jgi:hypothetical protein